MADRRNKTMRDMGISMGVIVAGVLLYVGLYGGFSFSPGSPSSGPAPTADVQDGFAQADRTLTFPVTAPKGIPSSWHPNSFTITQAQSGATPVPASVAGGWLTPSGAFITLIESAGSTDAVLQAQLGLAEPATGSIQVDGVSWTITPGRRAESAWVRSDAGVVFLITGSADSQSFETLAHAVASGLMRAAVPAW